MNPAQRAALLNPKQAKKDKARSIKSDSARKTNTPTWDPKLLTPKSKRTRDALKDDLVDDDPENEDGPGFGQSGLLMKQFGVGEREYVPNKRHKSSAQDEQLESKPKATFSGSGSGGDLGKEIKRMQDEGAAEAGPRPGPVVDLTAGDDDDIQITKTVRLPGAVQEDPKREVCMGMISAKIMADTVPAAPNKALAKLTSKWPACKIALQVQQSAGFTINVIDGNKRLFGKLDFLTASALSPLLSFGVLRAVAFLNERQREDGEQPGNPISKPMECRITLYAPADRVTGLGKLLSQKQIFLSRPPMVEVGKEVINPHVPNIKVLPRTGAAYRAPIQPGYKERTTEEIKQDVLGMFDRLITPEELPTLEADTSVVKTELMSHQKQALYFLTKQETPAATDEAPSNLWKSSINKDGTNSWYNVITSNVVTSNELRRLDLSLGGIFADMMGLGKTLSMLSRICATLKEAKEFGKSALPTELKGDPHVVRNTKGTLLVCPKSVLSNWDEQIKAHLDLQRISFYVYHGPKREQDLDELAKYDIVITSYTTVGSESTSNTGNFSAVKKLNWYRVVLDEAHMIRNQGTNVSKAACTIHSKRRWAVTGTPIQNRLDDLGALMKFLRIYPFHEKGAFETNFLAPFKSGNPQVVPNLHLLVGSMTLRRGKEKIDLPERKESWVQLDFSDSERALYEAFSRDSKKKLMMMVGNGQVKGKSMAHILVSMSRLRLICAHGRELLSEDDLKLLQGSSWDTAIDLGDADEDQKPAMTEAQVYDTFYLLRESNMDMCAFCNDTIGKVTEGEVDDYDDEALDSDVIGYMTPCLHALCPRCIDEYRRLLTRTITKDNYATCPTCEQYNKAVTPEIRQSGVQADLERRQIKKLQPTKKGGHYTGPHTKVKALVSDLLRFQEGSKELQELGEAPIRSVVFSGWTTYLDLIEIALNDNEIPFLRLDGKMSVSARSAVLSKFKEDPNFAVILVSIKAGGQGLNFTAANKVFMMEPQFNPGVEMQAVDRVHRLGQKRAVEIKKFIMKDSFEEKIVEIQKKKMELAQLAHQGTGKNRGSGESIKERMEYLRSLFK